MTSNSSGKTRSRPEEAIRTQKRQAEQNYEAVRVTLQAMRYRKVPPESITVKAVAEESGVPTPTIYRRDDLFALIQKLNPKVQRRQSSTLESRLNEVEAEVAQARSEVEYYKQQANLTKLGDRSLQQENAHLRKRVVDLQREVQRLTERLKTCACRPITTSDTP